MKLSQRAWLSWKGICQGAKSLPQHLRFNHSLLCLQHLGDNLNLLQFRLIQHLQYHHSQQLRAYSSQVVRMWLLPGRPDSLMCWTHLCTRYPHLMYHLQGQEVPRMIAPPTRYELRFNLAPSKFGTNISWKWNHHSPAGPIFTFTTYLYWTLKLMFIFTFMNVYMFKFYYSVKLIFFT